jgi:hypothetical protein
LHVRVLRAPQQRDVDRRLVVDQHVDLGVGGVGEQCLLPRFDPALVDRDLVALPRQRRHALAHRVVDLDVAEHLDADPARLERQRQVADEELAGDVDEARVGAHQPGHPEVAERRDDHLTGREAAAVGRVDGPGVGPEQEFVGRHVAGAVVDGLSPDVHR